MIRVLKGSGGYDVAYRIDGNKVLIGYGGYDVAYTINGDKVYKGSVGYGDVAYTINGDKVYKGSVGYGDVAYTINGNNIYEGSAGYGDIVYRLDTTDDVQEPVGEEKPGCLGMVFKFIAFCVRLFKTWSGRVGMILGATAGIAMASQAKDFMNALFIGIFAVLLLIFIGGGLGTLVGFIFRKSSKTGKFGGFIGAGALAVAGAILGLVSRARANEIILFSCFGIVVGWIVGTVVGAIVGAITKQTAKIQ
jgi:hypothetical protein